MFLCKKSALLESKKMIKLRSKRFGRSSSSKISSNIATAACATGGGGGGDGGCTNVGREIKWELRPGGMLVQKREVGTGSSEGDGMIIIRVSNVSQWHDISIEATSTFGELKMILSLVTELEPKEQRLLFKGKERDDKEFLHMVGVRDKDKVLLYQDPAIKEMKKKLQHLARAHGQAIGGTPPFCTISV